MKKNKIELLKNIEELPEHEPYITAAGFKSKTIPSLFFERCFRTPNRVAFRYKDRGLYKEVTWQEYFGHVESFCLGLVEMGLKRGDRVAIMGDPCPEWFYADIATQSVGAISYGIYSTSSISETKWMVKDGGAKFFVAQNQEFVDKILLVADELPNLKKIIVVDTRALFMYSDPRIIDFTEVTKVDSSGLAMLVELWQLLTDRRAGLELRGLSENALRLMRLAQLDQLLGGEVSGD